MRVLNSDKFDHIAEDLKHSKKYSSHNLVQIKEEEKISETIDEEIVNETETENEINNENEVENNNHELENDNSQNDGNGNEIKDSHSDPETLEKAN